MTASLLSDLAAFVKADRKPSWLNPSIAADIHFDGAAFASLRSARTRINEHIRSLSVDVIVQPDADRRKRLLIADMDSTMIGQECIDELAGVIGLKEKVAAITERAMRGEMPFEGALRERVSLLAGLDAAVVDQVIEDRITLTPGARTLIATMRKYGNYCALVSGGFTAFTNPIAAKIGFDEHRANVLKVADGRFTGEVEEPILGKKAKRARLLDLCQSLGVSAEQTIAVGDGANDLDMVRSAGLGVSYRGKPALCAEADAVLDHSDLTALLYAQGYSPDMFTSSA